MKGQLIAEYKIEGLDELKRNFTALKRTTQANVLRSALRGAGKAVVSQARRLVPIDTGLGKKSITQTVDRDRRNRDLMTATIGFRTKAYYLGFQELGTVNQPAQPFLRPALKDAHHNILKAFFDTLGKRMEKIRAKGR